MCVNRQKSTSVLRVPLSLMQKWPRVGVFKRNLWLAECDSGTHLPPGCRENPSDSTASCSQGSACGILWLLQNKRDAYDRHLPPKRDFHDMFATTPTLKIPAPGLQLSTCFCSTCARLARTTGDVWGCSVKNFVRRGQQQPRLQGS